MYADNKPCSVCGSPVELAPHEPESDTGESRDVIPSDATIDDRICSNPDCPSHRGADRRS